MHADVVMRASDYFKYFRHGFHLTYVFKKQLENGAVSNNGKKSI